MLPAFSFHDKAKMFHRIGEVHRATIKPGFLQGPIQHVAGKSRSAVGGTAAASVETKASPPGKTHCEKWSRIAPLFRAKDYAKKRQGRIGFNENSPKARTAVFRSSETISNVTLR